MERVFHKAKNFRDAEEWGILQEVQMTPEERQEAAEELVKRVYGTERADVREAHPANSRNDFPSTAKILLVNTKSYQQKD